MTVDDSKVLQCIAQKLCRMCGKTKPITEYFERKSGRQQGQQYSYCKSCSYSTTNKWRYRHGAKPMSESRDSPVFLGVFVAERALSEFFDHIERMPYGNPGYDFICGKGFKIDVKSSCLRHGRKRAPCWNFRFGQNQVADYFLCIGFNNREELTPMHVWLIPCDSVRGLTGISVSDLYKSLAKWSQYERPMDKINTCCEKMKG